MRCVPLLRKRSSTAFGPSPRNRIIAHLLACTLAGLFGPCADATDLVEAYDAARARDPAYAAQEALVRQRSVDHDRASALWRPSILAGASAGVAHEASQTIGAEFDAPAFGRSDGVNFRTSVSHGRSGLWSVTAEQPVYDARRRAQARSLEATGDTGSALARHARADEILHVFDQYFAVVESRRALRLARDELVAVNTELAQARERFRLGDSPVTDVTEVSARADELLAEVDAATDTVSLTESDFEVLTGIAPEHLMMPKAGLAPLPAGTLDEWLQKARLNNPDILMAGAAIVAATQKSDALAAATSPTVGLVAQASGGATVGDGAFGASRLAGNRGFVGIQLSVPLYTGGMRSADRADALAQLDHARAQALVTEQAILHETRRAWFSMQSANARVQALESARLAARERLNATRIGQRVGDRTTLDLLNAEDAFKRADLDVLRARVNRLRSSLELAAAAGALDDEYLVRLNRELGADD